MRGSITPQAVANSNTGWTTLFNAASDGQAAGVGLEADSANTVRINVRWTDQRGRINYCTLKPGAYKILRAERTGLVLLEAQGAVADSQNVYFDMLDA